MCGIVGYVGPRNSVPIIMDGLKRLEYRGYDSAGIALISNGDFVLEKRKGKIKLLSRIVSGKKLKGDVCIGHTRWATHGEPNKLNAHPQLDCSGSIAVIHNGIVENYSALRSELESKGHRFRSQTDTEIFPHLIEEYYTGNLEEAVQRALSMVIGTYGLAVISKNNPDRIVAARQGSPLIVGLGADEYFLASDAAAIIAHTKNVIYLKDGEIVVLSRDGFSTFGSLDEDIHERIQRIEFDLENIEKGGYDHFMLKEICEQPDSLENSLRGRLLPSKGTTKLGGLGGYIEALLSAKRIYLTACGTSWHAALIGEYIIEDLVGIPVEVEYASEFRYRNPIMDAHTVVIAISQSGETADTLAAVMEAKKRGALTLGICNVVGSSIARETDAGVYLHAGPEIGVASTKAFTSQVAVLLLISLSLARMSGLSRAKGREIVMELMNLPMKVKEILKNSEKVKQIAENFKQCRNFLYLGRGYNFPVALEGALKLKEISYIHAEGYPAAEMKHGPIALIDENMPVVFIAPPDKTYDKILSNIQEVKARKGKIIVIAGEGDERIHKLADYVIYIPHANKYITPILSVIPLQLLAYYIAVLRGCDVDQPRNLAKSVTVE